ncbi:MAG: SPFH domain-containing protein [Candidatus Dormibacteraeota bacterium]|nr:SPFH domain-containing protein [Candidatus Dormibacteraeota bacterium]
MKDSTLMREVHVDPQTGLHEREAPTLPGIPVLAGIVLLAVAGAVLLVVGRARGGELRSPLVLVAIVLFLIAGLATLGLTQVVPGQARVVQLFGGYRGTIRSSGLRWVNPLTARRRISTRIRNHETSQAKVNDADGNPIEIAAVVVWRVEDTAQAVYEVEDVVEFVAIQTESAVRHVASAFPYEGHGDGRPSLRQHPEEVGKQLTSEIAVRVEAAGVHVVESRLTRLSFAPEIAQAMLRRQQAEAVVAARQRIVDGAVGMVEMALERLDEKSIVDLEGERRAAMVSNLLTVLCSDQPTQPIVNAGSLYT